MAKAAEQRRAEMARLVGRRPRYGFFPTKFLDLGQRSSGSIQCPCRFTFEYGNVEMPHAAASRHFG